MRSLRPSLNTHRVHRQLRATTRDVEILSNYCGGHPQTPPVLRAEQHPLRPIPLRLPKPNRRRGRYQKVSRRGGGKLRRPQSSLLLLLLLVRRNLGGRLYLLEPRKLMALVQSIEGECFWLVIFIFVSKTESY